MHLGERVGSRAGAHNKPSINRRIKRLVLTLVLASMKMPFANAEIVQCCNAENLLLRHPLQQDNDKTESLNKLSCHSNGS
jgi:hypothetical protein